MKKDAEDRGRGEEHTGDEQYLDETSEILGDRKSGDIRTQQPVGIGKHPPRSENERNEYKKNADSALWKRMLAPNDTLSAVLAQSHLRQG